MKTLENVIELHDSEISGIEKQKNITSICFSGAYLYAEGKGWSQELKLTLENALLKSTPSSYPVNISEGELEIGHVKFNNLLELPFSKQGMCNLSFIFTNGEQLTIQGNNPCIEVIGERIYVEEIK